VKRLFLDTNVIIDFLANREPFAEAAGQLFSRGLDKKAIIYSSAISFNNIYYLLRQIKTHYFAIRLLDQLADMVEVVAADSEIIRRSIHAGFQDFEDAIQYFSALSIKGMDGIVTRNTRDFKKSELPVLSPLEALNLFK
jgi:predicted nucleic acid-binding protein